MGKPVVQHSIPALKLSSFKTNFAPEDLRLFHRPRTRLPTSKKIKVTPAPVEGSRTNPRFKKQSGTIRRKRELSGTSNRSAYGVCVCVWCALTRGSWVLNAGKDGRVVLAEYLEERPPVLSNVGMGTKILNYYRYAASPHIPRTLCHSHSFFSTIIETTTGRRISTIFRQIRRERMVTWCSWIRCVTGGQLCRRLFMYVALHVCAHFLVCFLHRRTSVRSSGKCPRATRCR